MAGFLQRVCGFCLADHARGAPSMPNSINELLAWKDDYGWDSNRLEGHLSDEIGGNLQGYVVISLAAVFCCRPLATCLLIHSALLTIWPPHPTAPSSHGTPIPKEQKGCVYKPLATKATYILPIAVCISKQQQTTNDTPKLENMQNVIFHASTLDIVLYPSHCHGNTARKNQ